MTIASGTRLGSFELVAQIGAGGMGEVYEARDTKLGRNVAIKVLPSAFVNDPERLARFQREARMLAALNHPNIATIYGLEQSSGTHFLIMELVSGETLAERIKREGALPVEEALKIAVQIAEGLEAAHEKGIIHRDLKPANVKVTPEGKVKVLDFGLAKAFASDAASGDPSDSPTLSQAATMQGVILGTAAYMSPEQARSKLVDKRTDIWSFGCVLYEMLTGKQAFHGEDITDTLAAVVRAEPDWQAVPSEVPRKIRDLLRRCLQKDKTLRMQAAGDVRIEIQETLSAPSEIVTVDGSRRSIWREVALLSLAAVVLLTFGSIFGWKLKSTAVTLAPTAHLAVSLPPGDRLAFQQFPLAFSPDGSRLAYVAIRNGVQQIYLRAMDNPQAKAIPGTEGAAHPFFSPDGQWIGFSAAGKLKKITITGGAAQVLCDSANTSADWGSDGTIVFTPSVTSGLWRVSADGGTPQVLTTPDRSKGETSHRWPQILPGGKALLFTVMTGGGSDESNVVVQNFASGERRVLIHGGLTGRYVPTGHLGYGRVGNLLAVPFDLARLEVENDAPTIVAEGMGYSSFAGWEYSFSLSGSLAFVPVTLSASESAFEQNLVWVDRNGKQEPLAAPPRIYNTPALSPEGRRVAIGVYSNTIDLWLYDITRATLTRLSTEGTSQSALWAPDGKSVAYTAYRAGYRNVFSRAADGSGPEQQLTKSEDQQVPSSWSRDGKLLAFTEAKPTMGFNIRVLRLSDHTTLPFVQAAYNEASAKFSPDGQWLAYVSDESGRYEVYMRPFPGPGGRWQISTDGGMEPAWNPDGRELFYRSGDKMMAVKLTTQPSFSEGKPEVLFQGQYTPGTLQTNAYDVSPDGRRFLMMRPSEQISSLNEIEVVQNWFEELKRRVPTGK